MEALRFATAVSVALAVSVAGRAGAAGGMRVRVPQSDLELAAKDGELVIRKGSARARLSVQSLDPALYPDMPLGIDVRANGDELTAIIETNCQGPSTVTFTRAGLEARLGKLVARLPYRGVSPRAVDQALAAMGFETAAVKARDLAGVGADGAAGFKGRVPDSNGSVVVRKGRVRLTDGGRVVAEAVVAPHSDYPSAGAWVAKVPGGVLVGVDVNAAGGCGAWGYDDVVWMRY